MYLRARGYLLYDKTVTVVHLLNDRLHVYNVYGSVLYVYVTLIFIYVYCDAVVTLYLKFRFIICV